MNVDRLILLKHPKGLIRWMFMRIFKRIRKKGKWILFYRRLKFYDNGSKIAKRVYYDGFHEFLATESIKKSIKQNMVCLDVGADKGNYSLMMAKLNAKKIYAFEPCNNVRLTLERNVSENKYEKIIHIYSVALSNKNGEAKLSKDGSKISSGNDNSVNIKVRKYDDYKTNCQLENIDFVKMDIEGHELLALKGMEKTLLECKPQLLVEVHTDFLENYGNSVNELIEYIQNKLSYKIFLIDITKKTFEKIMTGELARHFHIHCIKN